jgi:hypothetical protein
VVRPGLASQALLNGEVPKAAPRPFRGGVSEVSEPDRWRLPDEGVSSSAADEAV